MQLTMLKESFFFLRSYKYEHFKRNFFCGTNVEGGVGHHFPCFWVLPRPQQSWFDIHYFDATIPGDYFRRQLRLNRNTFSVLLNILRPRLTRQNTHLRDCVTLEKLLALGLYRLAHGNSYITIGPNFNVGKSTVI